MTTINCRVFKAQKKIAKSGSTYFQQVVEITQENAPNQQILRLSTLEDKVLEEGNYTASLKFYTRRFDDNGATKTFLIASLSNYQKA